MALTDDEYKAIAKRAYETLRKVDPDNIFAVGVGGRERAGRPTGEIVLKVFVDKKIARSALARDRMIPEEFEGVPTDVVVATRPAPDVLSLVPGFKFGDDFVDDTGRYRPVKGGIQIQSGYRRGSGTLGFLSRVNGDTRVMAITNYHVMFIGGTAANTSVLAGNPDPDESCTKCCENRIGTYVAGHYDPILDAAISKLDGGMQWLAEIEGIGPIKGRHDVTVAEAATLTYNARKRGRTTGLTGGTVQAVGTNFTETNEGLGARPCTNAIAIKPNPRSDGADVRFSAPGDSGSAYVNDANEIIGLHFSGRPTQGLPDTGWGWGTEIKPIIDHFTSQDSITLVPATATAAGQVQTVPSASEARALMAATGEAQELARKLEAELSTTEAGRVMTMLWLRHSRELNALVNGNRKVAVLWHRNSGPALFQHAIRAARLPDHVIPVDLDGRAVEERVATILDMFSHYGSDALKADLATHRMLLPPLAGRSYQDILRDLEGR